MTGAYDAITIGSGLGGLTAAALYARAGHRVLVLERNAEFGGAATTYQHGRLTIEASLHETADLGAPLDPKARILRALGILDDLEFVPVGGEFYEVRGRLFDPPFVLPYGFDAAETALARPFPAASISLPSVLPATGGVQEAMSVVGEQHDSLWWFLHAPALPLKLWPLLRDMRLSLSQVFDQLFGDDEATQARARRQPQLLRRRSRPAVVGVLRARPGRLSGQRRHLHPGRLRCAQPQPGRRGGGRRRGGAHGPHGDRDHPRRPRPRRRGRPHRSRRQRPRGGPRSGPVRQRRPDRTRRGATAAGAVGVRGPLPGAASVDVGFLDRAGAEPAPARAGLYALLHDADTGVDELSFGLCALRRASGRCAGDPHASGGHRGLQRHRQRAESRWPAPCLGHGRRSRGELGRSGRRRLIGPSATGGSTRSWPGSTDPSPVSPGRSCSAKWPPQPRCATT